MTPAIPAATLVVMREAQRPELLFIERSAQMAFAAGALAFPGGRIDPDDRLLADRIGGGMEDAAARIAAIRETVEETAIPTGFARAPEPALVAELQRALAGGELFSSLVASHGLELDLAALAPFSRWMPTFKIPRRFDTLFFVAPAPPGEWTARPATAEAVRSFWAAAGDVLDAIGRGEARAIFPTRRNLERLARFASLDEARRDAERHGVSLITPWVEERGGEEWLCIPEDAGYPVTAERLESAGRM
jgi:8-oxo-dGTP pyrophosphatase MutT (NUDIX family)